MHESSVVVVVGAGAAGMATAIAAARRGASVMLLEQRDEVGGVVTRGLIHTLGGLFNSLGEYLNDGLPRELAERVLRLAPGARKRQMGQAWTLVTDPSDYYWIARDWLAEEPRLRVFLGVRNLLIERDGSVIRAVRFVANGDPITVSAVSALVDCTGNASVACTLDAGFVRTDDGEAMAGWVLQLRDVEHSALRFPNGVAIRRQIQAAVAAGRLPPLCSHAWLDTGVADDEVYVKLALAIDATTDTPIVSLEELSAIGDGLLAFLRRIPAFSDARVMRTGEVSRRGGARIIGEYCLTVADLRERRSFPDAACRCAWPIEYWDPATGVRLEYLRDGGYYEIPLRALKVAGLENMWSAGKCLSADLMAQASARIAGCCWAMGEAAGSAAASLT